MRRGLSVERERAPSSEDSMGAAMCQARAGPTKTRRRAWKEKVKYTISAMPEEACGAVRVWSEGR